MSIIISDAESDNSSDVDFLSADDNAENMRSPMRSSDKSKKDKAVARVSLVPSRNDDDNQLEILALAAKSIKKVRGPKAVDPVKKLGSIDYFAQKKIEEALEKRLVFFNRKMVEIGANNRFVTTFRVMDIADNTELKKDEYISNYKKNAHAQLHKLKDHLDNENIFDRNRRLLLRYYGRNDDSDLDNDARDDDTLRENMKLPRAAEGRKKMVPRAVIRETAGDNELREAVSCVKRCIVGL